MKTKERKQYTSEFKVRAFELRLVKQIVVSSVTGEGAQNDAYVRLLSGDNRSGIKAKVDFDVVTSATEI